MFVMSHFPTTVFFFCFIITKTKAPKSKDTKQNKNNHTCTIESKSAPSENIRSAETNSAEAQGKFSSLA